MLWLEKENQQKKREERQENKLTHHGEAEWETARGKQKQHLRNSLTESFSSAQGQGYIQRVQQIAKDAIG